MTVSGESPYDDDDRGPQSNAEFAALRKANQAAKRAEAERDQAKREAAFLRAGIDPEAGGIASYFVKGYDGDLSRDAILAAATEAGIVQPAPPSPEQQQRQEEVATTSKVAAFSTNAEATPTRDEAQRAAMEEAYRGGGIDGLTAYLQSQGVPQVEQ